MARAGHHASAGGGRPRIRVGTSGWSYDDWKGVVYPDGLAQRECLSYLAGYVDAIEVNSSFYRPPTPRMTAAWVRRTEDRGDGFRFTFKLHRRFTHDRREPWSKAEADEFRSGLAPVAEAGRLGAVLLQFPWSFRAEPAGYTWLHRLEEAFGEWPLAVEIRHDSWLSDEALNVLELLKMSVANIDQPQLRRCIPPGTLVTGPLGYVRLHGRRSDTWFADSVEPHERYNYLYGDDELDEWVGRIREISRRSREVYVFTNNHYRGQAPANAMQLLSKLRHRRVEVPEPMLRHFPFLEDIAVPPEAQPGSQGRLF